MKKYKYIYIVLYAYSKIATWKGVEPYISSSKEKYIVAIYITCWFLCFWICTS